MGSLLNEIKEKVLSGQSIDGETVLDLAAQTEPEELISSADDIRNHFMGTRFHLCSIINARSGNCSEDCRFCAQSARYSTDIKRYEIVDTDQAIKMAEENDTHGVKRISLVTSGKSVSDSFLEELGELYKMIKQKTSLEFCGSMGLLTRKKADRLKEFGVSRYHCNLESCRDFFPKVCKTHTWKEKVETLNLARDAGMSICSGGIIGMGESMDDRIAMALELREVGVRSIPINILTPIPNTPFADLTPLPVEEVLVTLACFRFLNPDSVIRIAGGRQLLGNEQYSCFASGANGAIVGDYLTTTGSKIFDDLKALSAMGYTFN